MEPNIPPAPEPTTTPAAQYADRMLQPIMSLSMPNWNDVMAEALVRVLMLQKLEYGTDPVEAMINIGAAVTAQVERLMQRFEDRAEQAQKEEAAPQKPRRNHDA